MFESQDAVLFVNVPFCIDVPRYAHGAYLQGDSAAKHDYLEAVMRELATLDDVVEGKRIVAVRIGGGGPSVMNPDQIGRLMRLVRTNLPLIHGAEMSVEALPNTVGVPSLTGWGQGKPNRVELQVGAIHLRDLAELERPYRVSDIQNAVLFLDKFGMNNVSLSLTYGIPGQTPESWKQTLRMGLDLEPTEVVVVPVTPADGAGLDEAAQQELYLAAAELLEESGFAEYAAGRFARGAGESVFVKALAAGADQISVGLGAVSCAEGLTWRAIDNFEDYCVASDDPDRAVIGVCKLDEEAQGLLFAQRALCARQGFRETEYQDRFGAPLAPAVAEQLARWHAEGLVTDCEGRMTLTPQGRFAWQWRNEAL